MNKASQNLLEQLRSELEGLVNRPLSLSEDTERSALAFAKHLSAVGTVSKEERKTTFFAHVNWKFRINATHIADFLKRAAQAGITFNYHQKQRIQSAFDRNDPAALIATLRSRGVTPSLEADLRRSFTPASRAETLAHLHLECDAPQKLRVGQGDRDIQAEILNALFGAFLFESTSPQRAHAFFDPPIEGEDYSASYWDHLQTRYPHLFNRERALVIARVSSCMLSDDDAYQRTRSTVFAFLASEFSNLNNHCYVAIAIEPSQATRSLHWELAEDTKLFAEKHVCGPIDRAYFRWKRVERDTLEHLPHVDAEAARFDLANDGFTYKDTFVIPNQGSSLQSDCSLLLLFEKNRRDETLLPCPACRSHSVQGNSYPTLGVRSWECQNPLCPDRSKYNRGKRYSFKALLCQQAIEDDRHQIDVESVRSWSRDIRANTTLCQAADMVVRHYSLADDHVYLVNWSDFKASSRHRNIYHIGWPSDNVTAAEQFFSGPFFHRFCLSGKATATAKVENLGTDRNRLYCGSAAGILATMPDAVFDGAITSPPYYNARDYSTWPNIYCYVHDMACVASEAYRCLKPGAFFLWNVFDYFDNENTVVFSAMGKKRIPLASYTCIVFKEIGFELAACTVWDKGEIEGKRGFNAGNFSPYYQAPFNCWEHILVFRKPPRGGRVALSVNYGNWPSVLAAKPVTKMVRGTNVHGHTAPFPEALPALLLDRLPAESHVLDPFAGSDTTGRAARSRGMRSTSIELHQSYCDLALSLARRDTSQMHFAM